MSYEQQYNKLKQDYHNLIDSETLRKYHILSKAEKLSRKIYGIKYSLDKLCNDFDVPRTTAKRILSLNKANKTTWNLIKQKKISTFRVAYILSTKDTTYQDEIIKMAMEKDMSTYEIKQLRIDDYKDIEKSKLQLAVSRGFSRRFEADYKLMEGILRLNTLLELKQEDITEKNRIKIKNLLIKLNKKIEEYIIEIK